MEEMPPLLGVVKSPLPKKPFCAPEPQGGFFTAEEVLFGRRAVVGKKKEVCGKDVVLDERGSAWMVGMTFSAKKKGAGLSLFLSLFFLFSSPQPGDLSLYQTMMMNSSRPIFTPSSTQKRLLFVFPNRTPHLVVRLLLLPLTIMWILSLSI